jgi:hypothetical protein
VFVSCGIRAAAIAEDVNAGLVQDEGDLVLATGQGKWVVAASMGIEHAVGCVSFAADCSARMHSYISQIVELRADTMNGTNSQRFGAG